MNFRQILRLGFAIVACFVVGMIYLYIHQGQGISGEGTSMILASQVGKLDLATDGRKDAALTLVVPPTNLDEAKGTKAALDRYLSFDGPSDRSGEGRIDWEKFRAWVAEHGKPETVAAFDHLWEERSTALLAYRRLVEGLASAQSDSAGLWVDARRTEQYVSLYNAFQQNEDALYNYVVRLSSSDFKN